MVQKNKRDYFFNFLLLLSLFFVWSPLPDLPWGSGYRYLFYLTFPLSTLYLLYSAIKNVEEFKKSCREFVCFVLPFSPLIVSYFLIYLVHANHAFDPGVDIGKVCKIVIFNAVVFSVLSVAKVELTPKVFFCVCAFGVLLLFGNAFFIAAQHGFAQLNIRSLVKPYSTIYGKCVALLAGMTLLGAIFLQRKAKWTSLILFLISIAGFFTSLFFLSVRSTILAPFFALGVYFLFSKKNKTRLLASILTILIGCLILTLSPMGERMNLAVREVAAVGSDHKTADLIHKLKKGEPLSAEDNKQRQLLNNSMGGRLAVWEIARQEMFDHPIIGSGLGDPKDHVNVKELFVHSKDYLPHFHSDYVQAFVVGGLILLIGLLLTQIWLLLLAFRDPLKLYLVLVMLSYGFMDVSFFDLKVVTCFLGSWMLISLWPRKIFIDGNGNNASLLRS